MEHFLQPLSRSCNTMPSIIRKKPKFIILHAGANDVVRATSTIFLNKLLQLKAFINEMLPETEITTATLALFKAVLTVKQLTNHRIKLKIYILDNRTITGKHLSCRGLHLNQFGISPLTKKHYF